MSWMLSTSSLLRPTTPIWLENLCQQLIDNDASYTTVELIHPRMDDGNAKVFANALRENHTITTLVLSCYSIVDDGTAAIGQALSTNKTITKLQLRDVRDVREMTTLVTYLKNNTTITDLSFRHCTICTRSAMAMANYFKHGTNVIQELRITDSQFIGSAFQILCQNGLSCHKSIERLYFVNDDIDGTESAEYIAKILHRNNKLQELYLSENNIGDDGVSSIVQSLIENHSITVLHHLDLRSNNITCTGAMSIQGLLVRNNNVLRTLILSHNDLCDHGMMAICRGLQQQQPQPLEGTITTHTLRVLDVNTNHFTSNCASTIGAMLRINQSLEEINLSFNQLCDDGIRPIVAALQFNTTLRILNVRRNFISNVGAQYIGQVLPHMKGLKELLLSKNYHIDTTGTTALLHGLQSNVELEYLQVDDTTNSNDDISNSRTITTSSSAVTISKNTNSIYQDIIRYTKLNKAGRRIFRSMNTIPPPLWPYVYSRISHDKETLFHFIKSNPDLFVVPYNQSTAMQLNTNESEGTNDAISIDDTIIGNGQVMNMIQSVAIIPVLSKNSSWNSHTTSTTLLGNDDHNAQVRQQQQQTYDINTRSDAMMLFPNTIVSSSLSSVAVSSPKRKKKKHCCVDDNNNNNNTDHTNNNNIRTIRTCATF